MFTYSDADYQVGTHITGHPERQYRKAPGISASQVKVFANKSPAHYQDQFLGEPAIRTESDAMMLGSLVHCLVLEPEHFMSRYDLKLTPEDCTDALVTVPQMKAWLTDRNLNSVGLKADLVERIIKHDPNAAVWSVMEERRSESKKKQVKRETMDKAVAMQKSVMNHPQARQLLTRGVAEMSVWGCHEETGQLIKCRPDYLNNEICIDLKTCQCASPKDFGRDVVKFGYDLQQAHYLATLWSAGLVAEMFVFVAVESEPPHLTQVYTLDSRALAVAEMRWQEAMAQLGDCQENKVWPGYTRDTELVLPGWYYKQYEGMLEAVA